MKGSIIGRPVVEVTVPIEAVSTEALVEVAYAKAELLEGELVPWRVRDLMEILSELRRRNRQPEG
jgi:polysaccharide pyruvyl transferase WcaK-like protein